MNATYRPVVAHPQAFQYSEGRYPHPLGTSLVTDGHSVHSLTPSNRSGIVPRASGQELWNPLL